MSSDIKNKVKKGKTHSEQAIKNKWHVKIKWETRIAHWTVYFKLASNRIFMVDV